MTIEEINNKLKERNISVTDLAQQLSVNAGALAKILSGKRPLTQQLERHIEYVLGVRKDVTLVYTVELPENNVKAWTPGFDALTKEEQLKIAHSVCEKALQDLIDRGAEQLTYSERVSMLRLGGAMPNRSE